MNKSDFNYVYYRYVDLAHYVANSFMAYCHNNERIHVEGVISVTM